MREGVGRSSELGRDPTIITINHAGMHMEGTGILRIGLVAKTTA